MVNIPVIANFSGPYWFLSNFSKQVVPYNGCYYKSAEHAFQATKMTNEVDHNVVAGQLSPGEAKKIARLQKKRDDWEEVKVQVMREILRAKFTFVPHRKGQLIRTEGHILIEGNTWGDKFWGMCNGEGQNILGRLLMELRYELMQEEL